MPAPSWEPLGATPPEGAAPTCPGQGVSQGWELELISGAPGPPGSPAAGPSGQRVLPSARGGRCRVPSDARTRWPPSLRLSWAITSSLLNVSLTYQSPRPRWLPPAYRTGPHPPWGTSCSLMDQPAWTGGECRYGRYNSIESSARGCGLSRQCFVLLQFLSATTGIFQCTGLAHILSGLSLYI